MRQETYNQIADMIDEYSSWIRVHRKRQVRQLMAQVGGELRPRSSRMLTLVAVRARGVYQRGHVWDIPEPKLEQALHALMRKGDVCRDGKLTVRNVEDLVSRATGGLLNLEMYDV